MPLKSLRYIPSILKIKEHVSIDEEFTFKPVSLETVNKSLRALNTKKAFPFMTIPPKVLKDSIIVIEKFILAIWNEEILVKRSSRAN